MIHDTIAQSIMIYAAEVWVINKRDGGKILATEMKYWKRCCDDLTKMDKITN